MKPLLDAAFQVSAFGNLEPFTETEKEYLKNCKPNQILRIPKISAIQKERSYLQLKRYFGKCRKLSGDTQLSQDPVWNSGKKVSEQIKWALGWVDYDNVIVTPNGNVVQRTKSISYKDLPHLAACRYFERADEVFEEICKRLKIDPKFLEEQK